MQNVSEIKNPGLALGFFIYNELMKNNLISILIKLAYVFYYYHLMSTQVMM